MEALADGMDGGVMDGGMPVTTGGGGGTAFAAAIFEGTP